MFKLNKFLTLFFLLILGSNLFASHYMGGEITWSCVGTQYKFKMKAYRECAGCVGCYSNNESLTVINYPNVGNTSFTIPLTLVSQTDISPDCNGTFPQITCATATMSNTGAVEEFIWESAPITLSGVPTAAGWIFTWGSCCRNPCTNILGSNSMDWVLRAAMYPYNGQNANPCFDNSPTFAERPSTVISTNYPFTYNHNAWDQELDSLTYEWATPLDGTPAAPTAIAGWNAGYSYNSPLPGTMYNPLNVPATVNPVTGEISFTSYTQGAFITCIKVTEYRCHQKIGEVFREMQVVLLPGSANTPPTVSAPFPDPLTGLYTLYTDTVYAGELVCFPMSGTDFEFLPPPNNNPQTMTITASGAEFGAGFTSTTTGCLTPPCATLTPPPPISGMFGVQTNFCWQTTCAHLATNYGCGSLSNVYNFVIKVRDDYCPAPAIAVKTITIVVKSIPVLPPPDVRCVAVLPNGDVTLTWIPPIDTMNSFDSYHLYSSTNLSGPYTEIDSVFTYATSTYTHIGANAQTQPLYYYIVTRSGCNGIFYSTPSDTLESILLNVTNTGTGVANLAWNAIHVPNLATSLGWYQIYREYPTGSWSLVNSTQALTYLDTVNFCNQFLNYRVEIGDSLGCTSVSSIDGDLFQDIIAPPIPTLDSVSVNNASNHAVLGWETSPSEDTEGYIIYQNIGGIWTPIDTIFGINNTFFENPTSDPSFYYESYCIAAFDSCMNTSPMGIIQNSIHLEVTSNTCSQSNLLTWNSYINMAPALEGYHVYLSVDGGLATILATLSSSAQSYAHTGLSGSSTYCYFVQGFNSTGIITSSSNDTCNTLNVSQTPTIAYIKAATVFLNNHVQIRALIDTTAFVSSCKIYRSDISSGNYNLIGTIPYSNSPDIIFDDYNADFNAKSYYYKIVVVDSCGNDAVSSNIGRTIYLTADPKNDMTNILSWNDYEEWLGNVSSYSVYRKIDDELDPNPIVVLPYTITNYVDDVSDYTATQGKFIYYIKALEGPGNPYLIADSSFSNEALAYQPPKLFIPNAFTPGGKNPIFIPFGVFIDVKDYSFSIYNRWGVLVFETNNPNQGWDGTFKGEKASGDVYVYYVRYKNSRNKYIDKRGSVALIR